MILELFQGMIEFEEKFCFLLEEKHRHCDLAGGVIQAMTKKQWVRIFNTHLIQLNIKLDLKFIFVFKYEKLRWKPRIEKPSWPDLQSAKESNHKFSINITFSFRGPCTVWIDEWIYQF